MNLAVNHILKMNQIANANLDSMFSKRSVKIPVKTSSRAYKVQVAVK